jgi:hypothetical protein
MLHEMVPFLVGMIIPPLIMLIVRPRWSGLLRSAAAFLPALALGVCISAWAGELSGELPDSLMAIIIDTSLVYTGSQLAYQLLWKPVLEARLAHGAVVTAASVRE